MATPPAMHAVEAEQVEPRTDRRLRRRHPFEQMPAGDEQPHQRSRDRVAHQPRLMRQESDHERGLGQRGIRRSAPSAPRWLRAVMPGAAWHDGARRPG